MEEVDGKVVLITGAARGIGFATAKLLGRSGCRVVVTDILEERLDRAHETLTSLDIDALALRADVTVEEDCVSAVDATLEHFGRLDILVNNAGISIVAPFEETAPSVCKKLFDVNVLGAVRLTHAALGSLKSTSGHLVFVSSVSGIRAIPTGSIYSASKAALRSLAESLRIELRPYGVHVGVITPGFTTSDPEKTVMRGDGSARPIDRPAHDTPEDVAKGILKLIKHRERERVLTAMGKFTAFLQRLSPHLLDIVLENRELKS